MKITHGMVVSMQYELTDENNDTLDATEDGELFTYLHGHGNIIPGLEKGLEGLSVGAKPHIIVHPAQGYGERDPEAQIEVPREQFPDDADLAPGDRVSIDSPEGEKIFTIAQLDEASVILDGNHPLAGMILHFDIEVADVRPATEEELEHGHAHSGDDHHH
jgi:FKBP-type peptidyl-prolyl cis-trans isomerase SlyD